MSQKVLSTMLRTRANVDKEIEKRARYSVQSLIAKKKKRFFEKKNSKSILVNLKTYGKLLNHSDYQINLVHL